MALSAARLNTVIMVSCLACVKTDVEAHETCQKCRLVYLINREKHHQPITFSFVEKIHSEYSDQMFVSGEMVFQVALAAVQ